MTTQPKPTTLPSPPPPPRVLPAVTVEAARNRKNDAYWHGKICPLPKDKNNGGTL